MDTKGIAFMENLGVEEESYTVLEINIQEGCVDGTSQSKGVLYRSDDFGSRWKFDDWDDNIWIMSRSVQSFWEAKELVCDRLGY